MSSYEHTVSATHRRIILEHLEKSKDYVSNADALVMVINEVDGVVRVYYRDVMDNLSWLETKGYVVLSGDGDFVVVEATTRGLRVAKDIARDDGIARPRARR